jgi:cytochrome c oxidase cbb3-type subunit 3
VSFPRIGFVPDQSPVDAVSSASIYAKHDLVPEIGGLTHQQQRGQKLYQANCAFCHAADGTGKNWIGQFMEPKARDLTQYDAQSMTPARLKATIRDGLPGTSMPAWRHVLTAAETEAIAAYVGRAFFATDAVWSPGGQVAEGDQGARRR